MSTTPSKRKPPTPIRRAIAALAFPVLLLAPTVASAQSYSVSVSPSNPSPNAQLTVSWTASTAGGQDWLGLYQVGASNTAYLAWTYTGGTTSGSTTFFSAPSSAGQYEIRYLLNNGYDSVAVSNTITVSTGSGSGYRIAISHDGNYIDQDDFSAFPMTLALLAEAGLQSKLVHASYNNHLGENDPWMASEMVTSANGAASRWGFSSSILFDCQQNLSGAIASMRDAINASSAQSRLYLLCAGPMEVCWRGINASDPSKRQYVTAVSHSTWNDEFTNQEMAHTWTDIQNSGVQTIHIIDQNQGLATWEGDWYWLRDSSIEAWRWLYNRRGPWYANRQLYDVSDAGMMYFVITGVGDQNGDFNKFRNVFENGL
jgi:hypothetical protein